MSKGANKQFLEDPTGFLRNNVIVVKNPQSYLVGKNVALEDVHEFDLVHDPSQKYVDTTGKSVKTYTLQLFETRKGLAGQGNSQPDPKKGRYTNVISAYYLPWDNNRHYETQLGTTADFMFTPTLDGCTFVVGGGSNPKVSHLNYQNAQQRIDQARITTAISTAAFPNENPTNLTQLRQADYSPNSHQEKTAGKTTELTVVGFRNSSSGTWEFCYQKRNREAVRGAAGGVQINEILADRLVRIQ